MKKPYLGCIPSLADPRDYSLSVVADVEYPAKFNVADVPIYSAAGSYLLYRWYDY